LAIPGLAERVLVELGRPLTYEELLVSTEPVARRIIADAADALGRFIALAANLTMRPTVVLGGEGIGLWDIAQERIMTAATAERDPEAEPLRVELVFDDFTSWARGAATLAIQQAMARL
jgi:predicted NBD/HSP70 family sugar kinase